MSQARQGPSRSFQRNKQLPDGIRQGQSSPPDALIVPGGSSEVREPLLEAGVGTGLTGSHW